MSAKRKRIARIESTGALAHCRPHIVDRMAYGLGQVGCREMRRASRKPLTPQDSPHASLADGRLSDEDGRLCPNGCAVAAGPPSGPATRGTKPCRMKSPATDARRGGARRFAHTSRPIRHPRDDDYKDEFRPSIESTIPKVDRFGFIYVISPSNVWACKRGASA